MKDGLFEEAIKILLRCVERIEETGPHCESDGELEY